MKKRLFIVLSALLALTACFTSCQDTPAPVDTSTTTSADATPAPETDPVPETKPESSPATDEPETEAPLPSGMVLTSETKIYCSTRRNRTLYKLSTSLATRISEKTGIRPTVVYGGDNPAVADSEIVLGYSTERDASTEAYGVFTSNQYGVHVTGQHAVLTAWNSDDLNAAADLFMESSLVQEGDHWVILPQVADNGTPAYVSLDTCRIVYAEGADAELINTYIPWFQSNMQRLYGIELEAVSNASEPAGHEIILGQTNRQSEAVNAYLESKGALPAYGYAVIPDGSSLHLVGGSLQALATAVGKALESSVQPEIGPRLLTAPSEIYESLPIVTEDKAELAEGAMLRIMSYNMLNQEYVPDNPLPPERDNRLAELLLYYKPDVIGVQEANIDWHNSFDALLPAYAPACKYHDGTYTAQTTFLYNPLTVKLIDEYVVHYTDWDDSDIRVVSFAVFETLATGKRFVMTNTHPAPHAEYYSGHMVEMNRILTQELAKYEGLPVIMTGDFNTREYQAEYQTLMTTQGVRDARYDDGVELVRDVCTYTFLPSGEAVGGEIRQATNNNIDHIFINDKVQAKLFNIIIDHDVAHISDHLPIYADIVFQ